MGKEYKQLCLEEREKIAFFRACGKSRREIGKLLGKSHSTISREVRRNRSRILRKPCYFASQAETKAKKRKVLAGKRQRLKNPEIRRYVTKKLKISWSPEQIAGRIRLDCPGLRISYESIYQFIYQEAWSLFGFLARKHKRRRLRFNHRKPQQLPIPCRTPITERPEAVNQRLDFGHWEADSMVSKQSLAAVHMLVERKSRYVRITKLLRNNSDCVRQAITRRLTVLPKTLRQSITYDNGSENFQHLEINQQLKTLSYFCAPYHSWEKGTVENSIGLLRRFIPKKTDLEKVSTTRLFQIENLINNRPRKCLNYQTSKEVLKTSNGALPA